MTVHNITCHHLTFKDAEFIRDCWDSMTKKQKHVRSIECRLLRDKFEITQQVLRNIVALQSLPHPPGYDEIMETGDHGRYSGRDRRTEEEQAFHYSTEYSLHLPDMEYDYGQ